MGGGGGGVGLLIYDCWRLASDLGSMQCHANITHYRLLLHAKVSGAKCHHVSMLNSWRVFNLSHDYDLHDRNYVTTFFFECRKWVTVQRNSISEEDSVTIHS